MMNRKIPKIVYGIPIVIISAIIINLVLDESAIEISSSTPLNPNSESISKDFDYSNNLYSGPFAIMRDTYNVNDSVFLIGSAIPMDSKGYVEFTRPDGKIHHTHPFDGSKSAVNHYFTPVSSSDLRECPDCDFFGTWKITFHSEQGVSYAPLYFEVVDSKN